MPSPKPTPTSSTLATVDGAKVRGAKEPGLCVSYGEPLGRYAFPPPHPFGANRLPAFWTEFVRRGLEQRVGMIDPVTCGTAELELFHSPRYVSFVREASEYGAGFLDYGDTPAFPGVFEAAATVVGTTVAAVRMLEAGRYRRAFSPIGGLHHARRDRAGGFCVFNDIGVAIEVLRRQFGRRRVGYIDIDVHHGDGVYYEFESDPDLFIADIHEDGRFLYPGSGFESETGRGSATGTKLNICLAPGAGPGDFSSAWERAEAIIDRARPDFLILQCGADGMAGDPLAHLNLTPAGHRQAAERARVLAERHCGGKILALGGGGYEPSNLATTWCEVVEALA